MDWQVIIAAIIAVGGVAAYLIYLLVTGAKEKAYAALKDAQLERDAKEKAALREQVALKAKQEAKELEDETRTILEMDDLDAKRRASLELLKRLRGVD